MGGWWAVVIVGVLLFGWTTYVDVRHHWDERLARWWLARARDWGPATGPLSFFFSTVVLACFGGLAWAADAVAARAGNPLWALVATGPAMLAYAPFVVATMPTQGGGYGFWRQELTTVGADVTEQRAIAWWAGPPSLLGVLAIAIALWSALVP